MRWPKRYFYLLVGLGVSQLGNWIYLIALNVMIWELTHSPAAVAGLYVIGPFVRILCHFFVGSYIDRWSKKNIVISTDLTRGLLVCFMPLLDQLWLIYAFVGLSNVASSFFSPSSIYLISVHVAENDKQRFNALHATLNSGSFMIGPALAGGILATSTVSAAMWVNGVTFFLCAYFVSLLPTDGKKQTGASAKITLQTIKGDWRVTLAYTKKLHQFSKFLVLYSVALMIAFALDSQEMTFLLAHLSISESQYGVTVTIAGIGAIIGGMLAAALANILPTTVYLKAGFLLSMLSYLGFYLANCYTMAVLCFITLGLFMAFSNTGFATLYQAMVQPELIGRFTSMLHLIQSMLQVLLTVMLGLLAEWFSLQWTAVIFASCAVFFAICISLMQLAEKPSLYETSS